MFCTNFYKNIDFLPSDICVTVKAVYKDASTENIIFSYNLLAVKSFTFFNCY